MALNTKVITQVGQVLAIPYVCGGCQCIKLGYYFTMNPPVELSGGSGLVIQ